MIFRRIHKRWKKQFPYRDPAKKKEQSQRTSTDNQSHRPSNQQSEVNENSSSTSSWTKTTQFRSRSTLNGSSIVKIWFETIDEIGIRFSLDLENGTMFERENWTPSVQMPGESSIDPEPLSVWGIDSQDGSINIIMHVGDFDSLYIDGEQTSVEGHEEVLALLEEITNVVVRDIWIAPDSKQV